MLHTFIYVFFIFLIFIYYFYIISVLCFVTCTTVFLTNLQKFDHGIPVHKKGLSLYLGIAAMILCVLDVGMMIWYRRVACREDQYEGLSDEEDGNESGRSMNLDTREEQKDAPEDGGSESERLVGETSEQTSYGEANGSVRFKPSGKNSETDKSTGDSPVDLNRGGDSPVDANRVGDSPVDPNRGGDSPADPHRGTDSPVDANRVGDSPVDPNRGGDSPVDPNRVGASLPDPVRRLEGCGFL